MTKQVARHGGSPAPYTKQKKIPYSYSQVPLHKEGKGIAATAASFKRFAERHGIRWPVPKPSSKIY